MSTVSQQNATNTELWKALFLGAGSGLSAFGNTIGNKKNSSDDQNKKSETKELPWYKDWKVWGVVVLVLVLIIVAIRLLNKR